MADGPVDLSGRFLRVPVEWVDRELHPWMESSAWRETYERLQRNGSYQEHLVDHGRKTYRLYEHQLLVSVSWLCECCPDLTPKSARILLNRLEEDGLISWPRGKVQGARVQVMQLEDPWRASRGDLREKRGRTRQPPSRRKRKGSKQSKEEEGRTHGENGANSDPQGANSSGEGANSGTEIESPAAPGASSTNGERPGAVRGFGFHRPLEGRTAGGGDTEGGGEGESEENPPSLSSLPPSERKTLVKQAANYCAPTREGVLPLGGKEMSQLEELVADLMASKRLGPAGIRDFFRAARRWADEEVGTDRINANFVRPNIHAIEAYQSHDRQAAAAREQRKKELAEQREQYHQEERMASWRATVGEAFDAEPEDVQDEYLEPALSEAGADEHDAVPPWIRLTARAAALERYAADREMPPPPGE